MSFTPYGSRSCGGARELLDVHDGLGLEESGTGLDLGDRALQLDLPRLGLGKHRGTEQEVGAAGQRPHRSCRGPR